MKNETEKFMHKGKEFTLIKKLENGVSVFERGEGTEQRAIAVKDGEVLLDFIAVFFCNCAGIEIL